MLGLSYGLGLKAKILALATKRILGLGLAARGLGLGLVFISCGPCYNIIAYRWDFLSKVSISAQTLLASRQLFFSQNSFRRSKKYTKN